MVCPRCGGTSWHTFSGPSGRRTRCDNCGLPKDSIEIKDLTPTDAPSNVSPTSPATPEKEGATKVATVSGKYQKHEVTGETIVGEKLGLKVTAWSLPDGKPAPKTAGLVGKTFETVGKGGVEAIKAIRVFEKLEPLPTEMRLIFKAEGASKPINAREVGTKPKASKNGASAPEAETSVKTSSKGKGKAKARASKGSAPKAEGATSEQPTRSRRAKTPTPVVRKMENQEGVAEGHTKFWCAACQASFTIETPKNGAVPDACPEGHSLESLDLVGDLSDQVETLVI